VSAAPRFAASNQKALCRQLCLTPEMDTSLHELRTWYVQNRNRCYVPEWLPEEWGIDVDSGFIGVA
jgi:hypothetical protein